MFHLNYNILIYTTSWELLQNLPVFVGFVAMLKLRSLNKPVLMSLTGLLAATWCSALLISLTEHQIVGGPSLFNWRDVYVNFLLFAISALAIFFYVVQTQERPWWMDLVVSLLLGLAFTVVQTVFNPVPVITFLTHILALTLAFVFFLLTTRYLVRLPTWPVTLLLALALTVMASLLIVLIDYHDLVFVMTHRLSST